MKRALVLLLAVAALVAGCGSGSGSGSGGSSSGGSSSVSTTTAASVLNAASAATKDATSAAFDAKLGIKIGGNIAGAGAGAALLQGPLTLELKGHAGKATNGKAKFDVNFALNYTGGSFTGEALSPDGKTLYVKMPLLMGPGWHSLPLTRPHVRPGSSGVGLSTSNGLDALKAAGLDPSKWLKNLSLSTSGGQDTISADVDLATGLRRRLQGQQERHHRQGQAQMAQLEQAIKTAHGSLSFDSSTHLPTDESIQFAMDVPPSLRARPAA